MYFFKNLFFSVQVILFNFKEKYSKYTLTMKPQSFKLAMPLLGMLLWVLSIHAGIFSDANRQRLPFLEDFRHPAGEIIHAKRETNMEKLLGRITQKDLNNTVDFATNVIGFMERLENNLRWSDIKVNDGTPSHGMLISFGPDEEAVKRGKDGFISLQAASQLVNEYCNSRIFKENLGAVSYRECAKILSRFKFHGTALDQTCKALSRPCQDEEYNSPYRSINGSCNNVEKAHIGESFTGFGRLLDADYSDGIQAQRRSVTKRPLPNSREIVNKLVKYDAVPSNKHTMALMQWSQFMEHDLSRPATAVAIHTDSPIECCSRDGQNLSPRYVHPFCLPIYVSQDKSYSKQGVHCLNFVRSIPAVRSDCSFGASDQVNQATHFLDGSQIYGSTNKKLKELRSFTGGKLATTFYEGHEYLPLSTDPTRDCQIFSKSSVCFNSGDARVNFQPQLALMHTIWYREHNRIADDLAKLNPTWDDETLFQETKRIVIAEMQKITYFEWVPAVLGNIEQTRILSHSYSKSTKATVSNSFATAAMRSIKSLSDGKPKFYDEDRNANESIFMRNYFNNPAIIKQNGVVDALIRGLTTQPSQKLDICYAEDLINKLYTNGHYGFDVLSFDIQRGRDHGLPSYNKFRALCGLKKARSFADLRDVMSLEDIVALSKVYAHPEDIDLIIGGLLEKPKKNALFGHTFSCIVADQMIRTRKGDRYFYDNKDQPKPFTEEQIGQIEKVTLARIMCDNGDDIKRMQPKVFESISSSNELIDCSSNKIPKIDLRYWSSPIQPETTLV
ncbi:salivary peroxidase/catechol oxidase-like isoform X3 [Rhynchophorus ferrugineus]|uniref:salivary peroxidase/catechol oxidase-like isoform X3 n=2 Tax=Rhynchophorus ferrugineus TaxID=354439 RepID=UPI003FCE0468